MGVKLKNIKVLKNLYDQFQMTEYFLIPVNVENEKEFKEQLKKFNIFRENDWFEIETNFVKLKELDFFSPHNKFVLNVQLNISDFFNQNFIEVVDIETTQSYVQFKEIRSDDYGSYYYFHYLKEGVEYQLYVVKENNKNFILRDIMSFYHIPKNYEDGTFIWNFNENTKEFSFWIESPDVVQKVDQMNDNDKIVFYFQLGLYESINEKFRINDVVLLLSNDQLSKILSYGSDIYLFFENNDVKVYDDFSLQTYKFIDDKDKPISNNVNKFYFLMMNEPEWETMKQVQKEMEEKKDLLEKIVSNNHLIMSQNYPLYFVKGTQPNYFYENYFQSPFVRKKQLYRLGSQYRNKNRNIDLGKRLNMSLSNNPDIKGIIPSAFTLYFQDSTYKIDFNYRYKQKEQVLNNENQDFQIVYDHLIGGLTIDELIQQLKDPSSKEQEDMYYKLILELIGLNNKIYKYDERQILEKQLQNEFDDDFSNYSIEELREKQKVIIDRYNNYKILLKNQFKNLHKQLHSFVINNQSIQSEEYQIKKYLEEIGFDINSSNENLYGILLMDSFKNKLFYNFPVGLIQYDNRQIMFILPNLIEENSDYSMQIDEIKKYKEIYCSFYYYFYVDDEMIEQYINVYKQHGKYLSRDEQEELLYKEFLEFYTFRKTRGNVDYNERSITLNDYSPIDVVSIEFEDINNNVYTLSNEDLDINITNDGILINLKNNVDNPIQQGSVKIYLLNGSYLYDNGSGNVYLKNDSESIIQIPFIVKVLKTNMMNKYNEIDVKLFLQELNLFDMGRLFTKSLVVDFENLEDIYLNYITGYIPLSLNIGSYVEGNVHVITPFVDEYGNVKLPVSVISYVHGQILTTCQKLIQKILKTPEINIRTKLINSLFRLTKYTSIQFDQLYNMVKRKSLVEIEDQTLFSNVRSIEQLNTSSQPLSFVQLFLKKQKDYKYNYSNIIFYDDSTNKESFLNWCISRIVHQNKQEVKVFNQSDKELNDVQIKLDLKSMVQSTGTTQISNNKSLNAQQFPSYSLDLNDKFNNIMFMNENETKILPHWCEKVDGENTGIVWVKVDNIPQNNDVRFVMYIFEKSFENDGDIERVFDYQVDDFSNETDLLTGTYNLINNGDVLSIPYTVRSSIDYPTTKSVVINKQVNIDGDYIVEFQIKGIDYNTSTQGNGRGTHQTTNVILNPSTFPIIPDDTRGGLLDYYQTVFNFGQYYGSKNWYSSCSIEKNLQGNSQSTYNYGKYQSDSGYILMKHIIKNSDGKVYLKQNSFGGTFTDGSDFEITDEIPQFDLPEQVNSIQLQIGEHYYGSLFLDWVRVRKYIDENIDILVSGGDSEGLEDLRFMVVWFENDTGSDLIDYVLEIQGNDLGDILGYEGNKIRKIYDDKFNVFENYTLEFDYEEELFKLRINIGDVKVDEQRRIIIEIDETV